MQHFQNPIKNTVILRAQWVLPIRQPSIHDGAVVIENGRISKVGKAKKILKENKGEIEDLGETILLPGLVNAHTHLEYSCLKGKIKPKKEFIDWLTSMIEFKSKLSKKEIFDGIKKNIFSLKQSGTVLLGEVTNTGFSTKILEQNGFSGNIFFELVGNVSFEDFLKKKNKLEKEAPSFRIVPACHAPHTVPSKLLHEIKDYLRKNKLLTSIHLAESKEEVQWIKNLIGPFSRLIQNEQLLNQPGMGKGLSPVEYLFKNDFLSSKVLCVHCVQSSPDDIRILKKKCCSIALCPRSNIYTGAGHAPLQKFLKFKIPLCLGTDSLASNTDLDLWNEMRALKKLFPFLPLPYILRMATLNGAQALGFGKTHGSIESGKTGPLIFVKTKSKKIRDPYLFLFKEKNETFHRYDFKICASDPIQS